jgi:phospholipid/cholesterol/gamma-HCH transport system substrate-binding protein
MSKPLRFRIGLFVLGSILLLGILVVLFGSAPTLFKWQTLYTVTFHDAPGVSPGTPVRRSGIRIGEVRALELEETGGVRVRMLIEQNYTLRRHEHPTIVQGLIGSDVCIDLIPDPRADADRSIVQPGEAIEGTRGLGVTTLLTRASEALPATQETITEVGKTMQRYELVAPHIEETLKEYRELAKAAREIVPELRRTNEEVQQLAKAVRETVPSLGKTNEQVQATFATWSKAGERVDGLVNANQERLAKALDGLNLSLSLLQNVFSDDNTANLTATLKNVRTGSERLDQLSKSADDMLKDSRATMKKIGDSVAKADAALSNVQTATQPFADRSERIMRNLDESTDKLNKMLTETRELVLRIMATDGTVQRLLSDPGLYNHLDALACGFLKFLPQFERIMKDVELFADKIARHPESLGIGGVVSPGSGIKR